MREIIHLNDKWEFTIINKDGQEGSRKAVCLPHTNIELPYNCFDEKDFQFKSRYYRELFIPETADTKNVFIDFEGVMAEAEIFINGKAAGRHKSGYTPFSIDITPFIQPGENCELSVLTDASENPDIPPFGHVIDYLTYGGIYREVRMRLTNQIFIDNIFIKTEKVLSEKKQLSVDITLSATPESDFSFISELEDGSGNIICSKTEKLDSETASAVMSEIENIKLWDIDSPNMYRLKTSLLKNGVLEDQITTDFGFRSCEFKPEGFYLNGKKLKIRGLNRHQCFPYTGYAMPERIQKRDADILKYELGVNLVRTSHYPQSRHFLDRCDEIGLLVFEEIPGWQHVGGENWKINSLNDVRSMIIADRNRPSIILWGVRINESQDDHDFYAATNKLAHELDNSRQTGGVRYIEHSELLEDVYTMNDFVHAGGSSKYKILRNSAKVSRNKATGRKAVPYIVTEHNGHMFPTKRFDNEERIREHALRHLRVLNRACSDPKISGAIGWCAFDYNTHREFGSGDRICYHGVSDSYRIPKTAAAVYASQKNLEDGIVLEPASLFAKGERSAAQVLPIEVYTNCDSIKLYRNNNEIGDYYPAASEYPGTEHPPIIINDLIGSQLEGSGFASWDQKTVKKIASHVMAHGEEALRPRHYFQLGLIMLRNKLSYSDLVDMFMKFTAGWGDAEDSYEIVGYSNKQELIRRKYGSGSLNKLFIQADDAELNAASESGTWDSTRIVFKLLDEYENIMPYADEYIQIKLEGPAEIIGPETKAFTGGVSAAWIRTTGKKGIVKIKAVCSRFESETVSIRVI